MKSLIIGVSVSLFFNVSALAKTIAVASKVKGNAFYMVSGKTKNIKTGTILPLGSEVFTELGAEVTLNDYYNHVFHLSGSGHISLSKNLIELKSGYLWLQTLDSNDSIGPMRVITANAEVESGPGEGIISFDSLKSKTQLLAVKGDFILRNSTKEFSEVDVSEGRFSYITTENSDGKPRKPTPVGYASYQKLTNLFPDVKPLDGRGHHGHKDSPRTEHNTTRAIASVSKGEVKSNFEKALEAKELGIHHHKQLSQRTGEVIFVRTKSQKRLKKEEQTRGRLIASYQESFKPVVIIKPKKKWKPSYSKKSPVKVTIFGSKKKVSNRIPASVPISLKAAPVKAVTKKIKKSPTRIPASVTPSKAPVKDSMFENQLMKAYQKQMRHKKELNSLIDELKSVDIDYQKEY